MREYECPTVELIVFNDEVRNWDVISGCNCHYDISNYTGYVESTSTSCKVETGHASENPFGIPATNWTFD